MADLEIDLSRHRANRAGHKLDLTAKEFLLLTLLARRAGEVLSRTQIAELIWDMNFDSDTNVVDVNVRRLRSKVDDPYPVKLIRTVRGAGYVLETGQVAHLRTRRACAGLLPSASRRPTRWRASCWCFWPQPVCTWCCEQSWIKVQTSFSADKLQVLSTMLRERPDDQDGLRRRDRTGISSPPL